MALNAKLKKDTMALNVKLETINSPKHQTEDATLNAKLKMWL